MSGDGYGIFGDPELLAGQSLRALRIRNGWSQEEVARRMHGAGYDWSQTIVSKIENATRPLRVRELADLARLFGVDIESLIYPSLDSSPESLSAAVGSLEEDLASAQEQLRTAEAQEAEQRKKLAVAESALLTARAMLAGTEARLMYLRQSRTPGDSMQRPA